MSNSVVTIGELESALDKYFKDSELLFGLIARVFNKYNCKKYYDLYKKIDSENESYSNTEIYILFKLKLLYILFDASDRSKKEYINFFSKLQLEPFYSYIEESDTLIFSDNLNLLNSDVPILQNNKLSLITECIIEHIIYRTDVNIISIIEVLNKHRAYIGKDFHNLLIKSINSITNVPSLNAEQKKLINKYDEVNPCNYIQIDINNDNEIVLHGDPNYTHSPRNFNNDMILQLYFLGEPSVIPIMYRYGSSFRKYKDDQKAYDNFVIWLWRYGQNKKLNRLVPNELKSLCIELLNIIAKSSTGTSYSEHIFPTHDLEKGWGNFWKSNKNALKREQKK